MNAITAWRVSDPVTLQVADVRLDHRKRRGRKPSVTTLHGRLAKGVLDPAPRNSVRLMVNGRPQAVLAGGFERDPFSERVERHRELLGKRKHPQAAETWLPVGQAALWYADVIHCVPKSGREAARQIARLCGHDSQVTVPIRSLAEAVGRGDSAGRDSAYTRRGIECLVDAGWIVTETTGTGQNVVTTFFLMPGNTYVEWFPEDDVDWEEMKV